MTRKKQMLLAIVGTIVIGGGVWFVGSKAYEAVTAVKVVDKVETVCDLTSINRIEFKDDRLVTLEKQKDVWKNIEHSHLQYDNQAINEWVQALMSSETVAIIKNVENESTYGITENSKILTVYDSENNYETYYIGSVMNAEDKIYIKKDGEANLYVIPFETTSLFNVEPETFVVCEDQLVIDDVKKVVFTENDKTYSIQENDGIWYLVDYYEMPCVIKQEAITQWIDRLKEMKLTSYVDTTSDLADYGLEQVDHTMTINDNLSLQFGAQGEKRVYVAFPNENDVYTIDKSIYKDIVETNFFDCIDKRVLHYKLDDIRSIEMINPQMSYSFIVNDVQEEQSDSEALTEEASIKETAQVVANDPTNEEQVANEKTTDGSELVETEEAKVVLCDKALNSIEAEEWLNKIQDSLQIEAQLQNPNIEQKEERKAECQMIYHLANGETVEIDFIPYDINYYILRYNGTIEFAVKKEKVTELFTSLEAFSKE